MGKILDTLLSGLKNFLLFLINHYYLHVKKLWKAKDGIPLRYLASDFMSTLRSVGMFLFLNLLALIVFTALPQGKDILLIIAEDISKEPYRFGNLIWLIIGVVLWSIVSEFGTRYSIYVTDNSAKSLPDERLVWRKALQKAIAEIFLMLPYLIVFIGFLVNYLQDTSLTPGEKRIGFGIPAICLYLTFSAISRIYFDASENEKADASESEKKAKEKRQHTRKNGNALQKFRLLSEDELEWCGKLEGIYNNHVFSIRKPENFSEKIKAPFKEFCDSFLLLPLKARNRFPKSADKMHEKSRIPKVFRFVSFTKDDKPEGQYKWVFKIPLIFYRKLHKQLKLIITISVLLLLIMCILPVNLYTHIGSPGLVVLAFGCWGGIYLGLLYMDYAVLRDYKVSLRFVLLLLFLFSSWFNNDHPVRYNDSIHDASRPELNQHFCRWFEQYQRDSANFVYRYKSDTNHHFYPIVFVCAEGGALRTGAFAAQTLAFLQDSFANNLQVDFKKLVYAYSGVSGGSVGVSFFNAAANLTPRASLGDTSYTALTQQFFKQDFLSPVIGKMFYADIINLFIPWHVEMFDRAIALEKSWELGFEKVMKQDARNIFSADYRNLYKDSGKIYPALFINTTEVESGLQCWLTNVKPDTSMLFYDKRDLLNYKIRGDINYSTMTNFSSRFPLFSPAAAVLQGERKLHYVDGGYVENTGAGTMLEILRALTPLIRQTLTPCIPSKDSCAIAIKPFVLVLRYNQSNDGPPADISFGNELSEILAGIYNTRAGRSAIALEELKRYTEKELGGQMMILPLKKTGSEVPMNWVLSDKSLNLIAKDISDKWQYRFQNELQKFFAIDTQYEQEKDTAVCKSLLRLCNR